MPYRVELSNNSRAGCSASHCNDKIQKNELRCGVMVTVHDHSSWKWRHWDCNTNLTLHHILESLNLTKDDVVKKGDNKGGGLSKLDGFDELPENEQARIIESFSHLDEKKKDTKHENEQHDMPAAATKPQAEKESDKAIDNDNADKLTVPVVKDDDISVEEIDEPTEPPLDNDDEAYKMEEELEDEEEASIEEEMAEELAAGDEEEAADEAEFEQEEPENEEEEEEVEEVEAESVEQAVEKKKEAENEEQAVQAAQEGEESVQEEAKQEHEESYDEGKDQSEAKPTKSETMAERGRKGGKASNKSTQSKVKPGDQNVSAPQSMAERGRKGGLASSKNRKATAEQGVKDTQDSSVDHDAMAKQGRKGGKASGKARASHAEENKAKKQRVSTHYND